MYRGQRVAQMLIEKENIDEILMKLDRSDWYRINRVSLPSVLSSRFYQFSPDDEVDSFLDRSLKTSNSLCLQFYYASLSTLLSLFLTKTSINGLLNRGGMFVFSNNQLRGFLGIPYDWDRTEKKLLDLGAGDGQVTEVLHKFYSNVSVTEASQVMRWRLNQRGFTVIDKDSWSQTGPYDLVSALNLLDRHYDPHALLADLLSLTSNSNCSLLVTVVLPLRQYVEFHPNSKSTKPDTVLSLKGGTFDEQVVSLVNDVFYPAGFEVIKWGKVPYLCEGDHQQAYYQLNDAVFLLKPVIRDQPEELSRSRPVKENFVGRNEEL